jgi:DNA-binding NtrC family response regulator
MFPSPRRGARTGKDAVLTKAAIAPVPAQKRVRLSAARETNRIGNSAGRAPEGNRPTLRSLIGQSLADIERDVIIATLVACSGNRTRAAEVLEISPRSLRSKLSEFAASGHAIPAPGAAQGVNA